jgi:hypothetical protein
MKVDEPPQKYQWLEQLGEDELMKEMAIQRFDIPYSEAAVIFARGWRIPVGREPERLVEDIRLFFRALRSD